MSRVRPPSPAYFPVPPCSCRLLGSKKKRAAIKRLFPANFCFQRSATARAAGITRTGSVAAATAAVSTTAAATAVFLRLGFINRQRPSADFLSVERRDRRLRLRLTTHLDKAKALASA